VTNVHFKTLWAQCAFWELFWAQKKHSGLIKDTIRFIGGETKANANKNAKAVQGGVFDSAVYSNKHSLSALRKWVGTNRVYPEGFTFWDEDFTVIRPNSNVIAVPTKFYGVHSTKKISVSKALKRKRASNDNPNPQDVECGTEWWKHYPPCLERWLDKLEEVTGANRHQMSLSVNTMKSDTDYWLCYPKTDKSRQCVQDPKRYHSQNRQQISISFSYPPTAKRRCHSKNHDDSHPNVWRTIVSEIMSPETPPVTEAAMKLDLQDLNDTHKSIYIYTSSVIPFRISIRGYEDITNVTPTCKPYDHLPFLTPYPTFVSLPNMPTKNVERRCYRLIKI
tara:strand:+ start:2286 stop:3290 length:1005 start_codon:yes stop_codon:yes gene_type:complete